ncbi:MAG: antibiotic biosynthesis monooxygenase family protein [Acidimicrobiales bacterium]
MFLRLFLTAVDPADVATLRALFTDDVLPVYDQLPGCRGIELAISVDHNAGGLVEGASVSHWDSREAMEAGIDSRPARESRVRIFELLRQEPVIRVFEIVCP